MKKHQIPRNADNPSRHNALECIAGCEEASMWSAESERDAKTLAGPNGDVNVEFTRRSENGQC